MTDVQREPPLDPAHVLAIAERLLRDNSWRLLTPAALAQRTTALLTGLRQQGAAGAQLGARPSDDMVTIATLRCYAQSLHEAFEGAEGEERQRLAYDDLLRYVYGKAGRIEPALTRDEREEIACEVVAELYYRVHPGRDPDAATVRVPGAFIAVALQLTRNAVRRWRRVASRVRQLGSAEAEAQELEGEAGAEGDEADGVYPQVERRAKDAEVRAAYAQALQRYPRANTQLNVVWMHHILELDYPAIAERLGISIESVRMLYHRGCKRLRGDPELRALADEEQLIRIRAQRPTPPRNHDHG